MMVKSFLIQFLIHIPKRISVSIYRQAGEYENKENRESNNYTKKQNWSSFKEAPFRNDDNLEMTLRTKVVHLHVPIM